MRRDRKALDPILYFIRSYTCCTPHTFALSSSAHSSVLVSAASLPPFPCLPSSPHPLTLSPFHHRPKNVRQSSTKQFARIQSCVPSSFISTRLLFSLPYLQGPLTQNVKRSISITNPNADPVSFKIKTTAPKVRASRVQIQLGLRVSQAVLRTAQLRQGRPRTDS
jgi:hypothetical protein